MPALLSGVIRSLATGPFDPASLSAATSDELESILRVLDSTTRAILSTDDDSDAAEELVAMAAVHPAREVRLTITSVLAQHGPRTDSQRELLAWAINDVDDEIARLAIIACERHRLDQALPELYDSLGRSAVRTGGELASISDVRAHLVARAMRALAPSDVPAQELARQLQAHALTPPEQPTEDTEGMLVVPGGVARLGLRAGMVTPGWFAPEPLMLGEDRVQVAPFYIDAKPVTNADYDTFVAASADANHRHCHPDEPPGTDHRRSTLLDWWAAPDHPCTGVSWFDAFSFAAYHGKELPTEAQWEYAAGGEEGLAYPWGERFVPDSCRWLGTSTGEPVTSAAVWKQIVVRALEDDRLERTAAVGSYPAASSPFGVLDLTGNVWEWTRSRHLDGADIEPRGWNPTDPRMQGDWTALACVKGGSWASGGDLLLNQYRGRRWRQLRGPEVGFRCVVAAEG